MLKKIYTNLLKYPLSIISIFFLIFLGSIYQSKNFELDASSDTLLIENDPDLVYLRELNKRYKSEDFFIITFSPKNSNIEISISELQKLVNDINSFKWVSKTISIINAPLLQSTNEPLIDRIKNLKYITNKEVKIDKALQELTSSPVYKNLIISEDAKTFGIVVYLKDNKPYLNAIEEKSNLLNPKKVEKSNTNTLDKKIKDLQKIQSKNISKYNSEIKEIIKKYEINAEIRLSGIPMIADDMISFIKSDIVIFGFGVFLFIIVTLWLVFRHISWVIYPLCN